MKLLVDSPSYFAVLLKIIAMIVIGNQLILRKYDV